MKCIICEKQLVGKQRKYCSNLCKSRATNSIHQNYKSQKARGIKKKRYLVQLKGGKCEICGYDKNLAALCFHHKNPKEKEMELDIRCVANTKSEKLIRETNKCILLCSNCHMEVHYPDLANLL